PPPPSSSLPPQGQTYRIMDADGNVKEFMLAHVPVDQARRPGFIQVLNEPVPQPPPAKAATNQRHRTAAPVRSAAPPATAGAAAATPQGADDLATRYARFLADQQKKNS
ncbi:hypothetical protein PENTCL1PPCAC_11337, partial [Pristionchus entomophagus]